MRLLLRNRHFAFVWWGGLISMTGSWMLLVALPMHVYQATGSAAATSVLFIAGVVPRVVLGTVAGVFVDRWDKKRTMVVTDLGLMVTLLPLVGVVTGESLWPIYLVALLQATLGQFFRPAETSLLPSLVEREELPAANALNALNNNLARFVGPAIGGVVVAQSGLAALLLLAAVSYLVAAGLVSRVRSASSRTPQRVDPARDAMEGWWPEWRAGFAIVRQRRVVGLLVLVVAITSVGEGVFGVLLAPFVSEAFGGGTLELGWLMSAQAVGGMAGGVAIASIGRRVGRAALLGFGALLIGVIDLVIINYPALWPMLSPALVLMVVVGFPAAAFGAGFTTLLQTHVGRDHLGRIVGIAGTAGALAMLVGTGAAGLLGDALGVVLVINVQAVAYSAAGVMVLSARSRFDAAAARLDAAVPPGGREEKPIPRPRGQRRMRSRRCAQGQVRRS